MDFQLLSAMKVEELKVFLRLRGLKVSGRKEELVARAFVAIENNVQIVRTAEEVEEALACQYTAKLKVFVSDAVGIEEIPDPFELEEGLSQTCNHVAAALFRIEAAVRMGLSNPSCTSKPNEWLPNNKDVEPVKIKNLKLVHGDFGRRGKDKKRLNPTPKTEI
eukprot:gene12420-biopygen9905